jgi:hypothetical protein
MHEANTDDHVQLPHGTDVVTRVDRPAMEHIVRAGSVGRVVGTTDASVDVQILGVGTVRYARTEVTPFRSGQVRYALARDAAWQALRPNVVLETTVGSHAWGLAEAFQWLDDAHAKSALPDEPANVAALERWLIDIRLRELKR